MNVAKRRMATYAVVLVCAVACDILIAQSSPPSAETLLAAAVRQAQAENKNIFVDFGASWCGPCVRLLAFLHAAETRQIVGRHLVTVSITMHETGVKALLNNPGAEDLYKKLGGSTGIPFSVFLDQTGTPLDDSRHVGFPRPDAPSEVAAFLARLDKAAPRLTTVERGVLRAHLTNNAHAALGWKLSARRRLFSIADEQVFEAVPSVSPDGRHFAYVNWDAGLSLYDTVSKSDRVVTKEFIHSPLFSRDGRRLIFGESGNLRVIDDPSAATPSARTLFRAADAGLEGSFEAHDWTPDGRFVAITIATTSGQDIGLVSTTDSTYRRLVSLGARRVAVAAFSPDGKYLAFDYQEPGASRRDIAAVALESGREFSVVTHSADDNLVGWADDEFVVFTSNRTGSIDLWATFRRDDGVTVPDLVASDIGRHRLFGLKTTGSLYATAVRRWPSDVMVAAIDWRNGSVTSLPIEASPSFLGRTESPQWSPDGQLLAYVSDKSDIGEGRVLAILTPETRQVREISMPHVPRQFVWSPDGRALAIAVRGGGIQRVDVATGQSTPLTDGTWPRHWSPDGTFLFGRRGVTDEFVVRHLASRVEQELVRGTRVIDIGISTDGRRLAFTRRNAANSRGLDLVVKDLASGREQILLSNGPNGTASALSPDGRFVATRGFDEVTKLDVFLLVPTDGSASRELPRVGANRTVPRPVVWSPDSRSLIAVAPRTVTPSRADEYWWIPIDGGDPHPLDFGRDSNQFLPSFVAQPAGRNIAFVRRGALADESEIWALEFDRPSLGKK